MKKAAKHLRISAFTVLESLVTLSVASFLLIALSFPVVDTYARIEEHLFFIQFEQIYRHHQKLSVLRQEENIIGLKADAIVAKEKVLAIPRNITLQTVQNLVIDQKGGNHSLAKIIFNCRERQITYQFYLGNGNYQKTSKRLYRP
ncbi:competence type IV pilus minor pilin ComGD [Streptococcus phocae subsp. phocae]